MAFLSIDVFDKSPAIIHHANSLHFRTETSGWPYKPAQNEPLIHAKAFILCFIFVWGWRWTQWNVLILALPIYLFGVAMRDTCPRDRWIHMPIMSFRRVWYMWHFQYPAILCVGETVLLSTSGGNSVISRTRIRLKPGVRGVVIPRSSIYGRKSIQQLFKGCIVSREQNYIGLLIIGQPVYTLSELLQSRTFCFLSSCPNNGISRFHSLSVCRH